jgi:hypothetical protein
MKRLKAGEAYIVIREQLWSKNQVIRVMRHLVGECSERYSCNIICRNERDLACTRRSDDLALIADGEHVLHFGKILCRMYCQSEILISGNGFDGGMGTVPMNQVGLNTVHSIPIEVMYFETWLIIGPSPTSNRLALNNTNLLTPLSTAKSMNTFIGGKQSIIGGATKKIALI